jgi:hypothetical protein
MIHEDVRDFLLILRPRRETASFIAFPAARGIIKVLFALGVRFSRIRSRAGRD